MQHKNIVRLVAFSEGNPQHPPCLVLERMEESLSHSLATGDVPPIEVRLDTVQDICQVRPSPRPWLPSAIIDGVSELSTVDSPCLSVSAKIGVKIHIWMECLKRASYPAGGTWINGVYLRFRFPSRACFSSTSAELHTVMSRARTC